MLYMEVGLRDSERDSPIPVLYMEVRLRERERE